VIEMSSKVGSGRWRDRVPERQSANEDWQVGALVMKSHANKSCAHPLRGINSVESLVVPEAWDPSRAVSGLSGFLRAKTTAIYEPPGSEPACIEPSCSPLLTRTLTSTRRFNARPLASELLAAHVSLHSPRVPRFAT